MLSRIHIKDLAIVTTLEVEFRGGMTVLTGETGAGKSILIDALGLVLGDRASNGMIRSDRDRAEITAVFSLENCPEAVRWLEENGLEAGEECILRRVLVREGSSRAFVDGSPVPIRSLQQLGGLLVDIHGQHAHQSLLRRDQQRELVDAFGATTTLCAAVSETYQRWHSTRQQLNRLQRETRERADRMDLLGYQVNELSRLQLGDGELEALEQEHRRLRNAGQLTQQCGQLLGALYDDENSTHSQLSHAGGELESMIEADPALTDCLEMLQSAAIQVEETVSNLRDYADSIEQDPQRLDQVEARLEEIHDLARKYRCKAGELNERCAALSGELEQLTDSGKQLEELQGIVAQLAEVYGKQAQQLHQQRRAAATRLEIAVSDIIQTLGMPEGRFGVEIETLPEGKAGPTGIDSVEFLVSANPGHPPQPLARVASGGELSRLSLGIQVATSNCTGIPTLIFDEVDVGIGGGVAEIVGKLLARLGAERQVLCVTHLPQVAAQGHEHLLVKKSTDRKTVKTRIGNLDQEARVREIARMLGGVEMTSRTLEHAREMMGVADGR